MILHSDGGKSGGVEERIAQKLDRLHGDVRALLYGLIGGFLFLIAGGAACYASLAGQIAEGRKDVAAMQVDQAKANRNLDLLVERRDGAGNQASK